LAGAAFFTLAVGFAFAAFLAGLALVFLFLAIMVFARLVKDAQNYALTPENKKYYTINSRIAV
jgi:Na+-transporting methylmalonyl-CoA/oxaloacetate decarboxylase gamma subunit